MAKYPWGNEIFSMGGMFAITFVVALLLGLLLALADDYFKEGAIAAGFQASPSNLSGTIIVTCVYCIMFYIFLGHQVQVKFAPKLTDDVREQAKLIADRAVINTQEQMVPFLVLLWLEALFVNFHVAQTLGAIYVFFRFLYPVMWALYGTFNTAVELSVQPNYQIVFYFMVCILGKAINGTDVNRSIANISPWLNLVVMIGVSLCSFICYLLLSSPTGALIISGAKKFKGVEEDDEYTDEECAE